MDVVAVPIREAAIEHEGSPTVILAKTVKGWGLGEVGEGRNVTHQQKKLSEKELRTFRDRFGIPISDRELLETPFVIDEREVTIRGSIGIAFSGGNPVLGTGTTLGRRLGTFPRLSATGRLNMALVEAPVDMLVRTGVVKPQPKPRPVSELEPLLKSLTPTGSGIDAAAMAAQRAALLTSARDIRATDAALDAAQRLLALGKLQSASDVLLDLIAHGFADREAQRLLIEVDCALGRRDVAKEKCQLLGYAYRLDGRRDVAEDVDRLARILSPARR